MSDRKRKKELCYNWLEYTSLLYLNRDCNPFLNRYPSQIHSEEHYRWKHLHMYWDWMLFCLQHNQAIAEQKNDPKDQSKSLCLTVQSGSACLYFMYIYVVTATAHELAHFKKGSTFTFFGISSFQEISVLSLGHSGYGASKSLNWKFE